MESILNTVLSADYAIMGGKHEKKRYPLFNRHTVCFYVGRLPK
jgi:hypothetical protein